MLTDINREGGRQPSGAKITRKPQRYGLCGCGTPGFEWNGDPCERDRHHLRDWPGIQGRNAMSDVTEIVNR
jgi:hypothetical protein